MAFTGRSVPSHLRHPSTSGSQAGSGQSPVLLARVNEKKVELENLRQLRDLSAGLASQMETLEQKLVTLTDGTEGEQSVHPSLLFYQTGTTSFEPSIWHPKIPKPKTDIDEQDPKEKEVPLPQTLVRVPTHQVAAVTQRTAEVAED
ncbi:MAG: hypothetical protein M1821_006260 [Bathelium mastoideum]|nr:MAG: hypothetical protein M1821_006260 [Bathelium mastoideum]KAI9686601.1 MAG: hypothetical protein M1822_003612 [Bathelium mastoideum]